MKTLFAVFGTLFLLAGAVQGLMFGLSEDVPIFGYGWIGGLAPTVCGAVGAVLLLLASQRENDRFEDDIPE